MIDDWFDVGIFIQIDNHTYWHIHTHIHTLIHICTHTLTHIHAFTHTRTLTPTPTPTHTPHTLTLTDRHTDRQTDCLREKWLLTLIKWKINQYTNFHFWENRFFLVVSELSLIVNAACCNLVYMQLVRKTIILAIHNFNSKELHNRTWLVMTFTTIRCSPCSDYRHFFLIKTKNLYHGAVDNTLRNDGCST